MDIIKGILKEIRFLVNRASNSISSILKKRTNVSNTEERYDIGIDDIKSAHEKIPKRLGFITVALGILIILVMTTITWTKQISKADENRVVVDEKKLKEPEVQISIDEQGWKHFQSRRIDMVAENTKKSIDDVKKEMKDNSDLLLKNVNDAMGETKDIVKGYTEQIALNMDSLKLDLSGQIKSTLADVDKKIKENEAFIKESSQKANNISANSQTSVLNSNSKLLPPPLNEVQQLKKQPKVKKEIIIKPESDNYSYEDVAIDSVSVQSGDIMTSLYSETIVDKDKKILYHIMKGLTNATLLTGINAPTFGGTNNKNPAPVLFSVDGNTLIANNEVGNIENCLISGSATGNVNTSKADVLLTEISCSGYDTEGNVIKIEEQIKGWVIGEDGSFGLQGRLLDSSGKIITKMIALEIIQAISEAMVAKSMPEGTSTYGLGSQTNIPYNSAAQQGLGSGIGSGLDRTFEHYSQILTGMYPTISVMAGKKVTLHLKGGEDMLPVQYDGLDINEKLYVQKVKEDKK